MGTFDAETSVILFGSEALTQPRFGTWSLKYPIDRARERFADRCRLFVVTDVPFGREDFDGVPIITIEKALTVLTDPATDDMPQVFVAGFQSDETLDRFMDRVVGQDNVFYYGLNHVYPPARFFQTECNARDALLAAEELVLQHQPRMNLGDYENILQALAATRELPGCYVEVGVFRGNSAVAALEYLKVAGIAQRASYFFDTFEGFTYEAVYKSQDARFVDTHQKETSYDYVLSRLGSYENCTICKLNIVTDNLPEPITQVAVANIDVDSYEATASALKKIAPLMVSGGIMICEDYGHTPATLGGFYAVREFLRSVWRTKFTAIHLRTGQLFLVRHGG